MMNSIPDEEYYLTSDNIADYYAWIEVDGKPLQVYGQEEKENKIYGYIEAQEGKEFVVCFADLRTTPPEAAYSTRLYVDGEYCDGRSTRTTNTMYDDSTTDLGRRCRNFAGKKTSRTSVQPFLFARLELTDDDAIACADENAIKNLGSISVKYRRVEKLRAGEEPTEYSSASTKKFHEKAKKAQLSHQAAFGDPVTNKRTHWTAFDFIDDEEHPLQTFEFRYRSRQLLQLEGLIPDSPTPSPRPSPSPIPQIAASPSPAQAPASPIASTSNARPAEGSTRASPRAEANERQRIARLEAELESLRRQERIATLERELLALRSGSSTTASGSSSSRKIKADPDARTDIKRVKREAGEASPASQASSSGKGKGKAKEKPAVIELSDSE